MAANNKMVGGGKRSGKDYYPTPPSMTRALLEREEFMGQIHEPACGQGDMARVIGERYFCTFTDVDENANILSPPQDFFTDTTRVDNIITNPPYSCKTEFVLHAKKLARYKIAMLLPLDFIHGIERYQQIFQDRIFPLKKVWVFVRRPMFLKELDGDTYPTGMLTYAWFIWERAYRGEPTIGHIDNNKNCKGSIKYGDDIYTDGQLPLINE